MIFVPSRKQAGSLLAFVLGSYPFVAHAQTALAEAPAKATSAPVIAPDAPVTTSGTEIVPPRSEAAVVPTTETTTAGNADFEKRIQALEERLARAEAKLRHTKREKNPFRNLKFSGFIQPQLLIQTYNAAASPNRIDGALPASISANDVVALPDGSTTNGDYFRLRRTRLRAEYETYDMAMRLEIDPLPTGGRIPGAGTIVRDAEAVGIAHWSKDVRTEFSAGAFLVPVRLEFAERSRVRPFIERSFFVQSTMPNGRDLGAHARTVALSGKLVADVGVVNGSSIDDPWFAELPDLNRGKDYFAQVTYDFGPLLVGTSGYLGVGQTVDAQALRVKNFTRGMWNLEVHAHETLVPSLGETSLTSELTFTQNMDAGHIYPFARPSIPPVFTDDVHDLHGRVFYVRVEQQVKRFTLGYRYDTYTPDSSIETNARDTHSFVASYNFSKHLRWMNELDYAIDNIHPESATPPSRRLLVYSSVLQAMF